LLTSDFTGRCNTNSAGIYQISFLPSNKIYIGSAINLRVRKNHHVHHLRQGTHHNPHLQNAWNKYGEENFEFEILITCDPTMCIWYEQQFIDQWKPEYNINLIAGSMLGYEFSEESKRKMSESAKNRPPMSDETRKKIGEITKNFSEETLEKIRQTRIGHRVSEETRKKIGDANRGKIRSEEVKKRNGDSRRGKHLSEETCRKLSEVRKGHLVSEETRRKISESEKGKIVSEETKLKIGLSHKGKSRPPMSNEQKMKISLAVKKYWETEKMEMIP
jgi:group I intron endonuclease